MRRQRRQAAGRKGTETSRFTAWQSHDLLLVSVSVGFANTSKPPELLPTVLIILVTSAASGLAGGLCIALAYGVENAGNNADLHREVAHLT